MDRDDTSFPYSPLEMASWVRDRSVRTVRDLARVVALLRMRSDDVPEDLQSDIHLAVSGALANALKLMSFAAGHHLTADDLSQMVGLIYSDGMRGYEEVARRLECGEDPHSAAQ